MKKWYDIIPYLIFGLGIIMDIGVNITGIYIIPVTESYMDNIFVGIITVSVLCFTLVTLIASFLDNSYLGYKLKDIIQFPNSPVNTKKYIRVSLLVITIGVCLLGMNFVVNCANSMTTLLLALILIEGNVAFKIWKMIINESYVFDLVISHFTASVNNKMDLKEFQSHTDTVINALSTAIYERNYVEKNKTCEMLTALSAQVQARGEQDGYYDYYKYFDTKLRTYMDDFAKVFGYNDMVESIVKIYTKMSDFEYGRIELYVIPLKNMRFWNDQLLLENNYFNQMIEIDLLNAYKKKKISNAEIERIFYVYFDSIMHNNLCTKNVREQLVENYIAALMKLQWNTNEDRSEPDVNSLLNILKHFVLKNNNVEERNYVFQIIIKQAFYNNMPYNKEKYFDFLALLFQSFYAFIFREGETLNQNYRDSLRDTFAIEFSTETIVKMSASWLLRINVQEILRAIGRRIQSGSDSLERRFENFPSFMMAKSVVWTLEFNVDFMLILYLVFNDEVGFYGIYEAFFNWGAINDECKISILEELQNQFDMETGLLKDDFVKQYKQYENLLEHSSNITEQIQIKLFQYICEAHSNLRKKKIIESEPRSIDIDYKDVMIRINELMKKDGILGWNSQYFTEDYVKFVMPDYISRRAYRTPQNTARTIQRGIIEALKSYIRQRANKLTLTFDIDGVRNMLMFICENEYDARNYTYTDDWSLAKLRNEPEFIKLEEKQKEIEFVGTPQIYDNLYFNKEKFCFNIKISKMDFIDLSERECEAFLEDSKGYNGLYNVDGALMPKEEAMKCIKKSYCKERYSFKLMVGFGKNDVTRIEFEH